MTEAVEKAAKPKKEKLTDEQKAANAAAKAKAAADKKAAAEAKKNAPKPAKDTKNGITRPGQGVTKLVWDTADRLSAEKKEPTDRKSVVDALEGKVEVGTVHTQYGRWRKYYGLVETKEQRRARQEANNVVKAEKAAKAKAEREATKAAKAADKEKKAAEKKQADEAKAAAAEAAKQTEQAPA